MKFLAIFLGVVVGVILVLGIIALILYKKFTRFTNSIGISNSELKTMIQESEHEARYREKSISGMTSILLPRILADFPNFSESEIFGMVENSLTKVLDSLEKKRVSQGKELTIIRHSLEEQIRELTENNIDLTFDEINFHKHVIKEYKKDKGVLSIKIQSSIEYFYEEKNNGKVKIKRNDWKKQTSYTTEFIYVYNPDEYEGTRTTLGVRCPNCGAPVKTLGNKICEYCSTGLEDINLKSWFISSYKEDER